MRNNKWMKWKLFAIMAVAVLSLTGCGGQGNELKLKWESVEEPVAVEKPAVAFMMARTANAKPVNSTAPMIQDTMVDAAKNYGYVFIGRIDGEAELIFEADLDIEERFKSASKERLTRDARNKATNLLTVLDEVSAIHPEVDYLEGLRCAANSLRSLDSKYTSRTIVCCGTGLGTTGYLDFKNNLLSAEPEAIVEMLKEREALPDLTGITVYWLGMGQVAAPQKKLTPKQSKNLERIWEAVIEAAGGDFVSNEYSTIASNGMEQKEELPSVSVVDIPVDKPIAFEPEELEAEGSSAFETPRPLGEDQVEFVGDEANYLYPEEALKAIRPIAEYLLKYETTNLLLVGATAGDITNEELLKLSQDRADAVKNTLVELGVDADRITAIGMGSDDPWHIKGAGYDGPIASSNRKVVLMDAQSEDAQQILNQR